MTWHALHQPLARGEADLPVFVGLDLVDLSAKGVLSPIAPGSSSTATAPPELAKSKESRRQVLIEPLSDVIHAEPPGTS